VMTLDAVALFLVLAGLLIVLPALLAGAGPDPDDLGHVSEKTRRRL
jgi:hypothetical protein